MTFIEALTQGWNTYEKETGFADDPITIQPPGPDGLESKVGVTLYNDSDPPHFQHVFSIVLQNPGYEANEANYAVQTI